MEELYFKKVRELVKEKNYLENKLKVKITIKGKQVRIEGGAVDEYEASLVLGAMQFGFSAKNALLLLDEQFVFRKIPIKNFTRRKELKEVRARIIGKEGKTKRTIENIASSEVVIDGNEIGIICPADEIEEATTAITNLIRGTKEANVYSFLERMNADKKNFPDDLGLKIKKKE